MEYKIEKGIPIPKIRASNKYPWVSELSVGESVFIPNASDSYKNAVYCFAFRRQLKLASRKVTRDGVQGFRFWRVK